MARLRISKIIPAVLIILLISYFAINIKIFWPKITRLLGSSSGQASIIHIEDGDTIFALEDGEIKKIRLIGFDAPELARNGNPDQCQSHESINQINNYFSKDRTIILQSDDQVGDTDKDGRYLRYVLLPDGRDLAQDLIRNGLGKEMTVQEYSKYSDYKQAEQEAIIDQNGLWSETSC